MAKTVFRPGEAKNIEEKVMLPLFKDYSPIEDVEVEEEEEYTGPTAEDLRREAEEYKAQFEQEMQRLASVPEPWARVSAAMGYALFDPAVDSGMESVFQRADQQMYEKKKAMKALRE